MSGAGDIALTLLYAPANRPDRVAKALATGADVVVVDLEDAVMAAEKDAARHGLADAIAARTPEVRVQVRVNARGTAWHEADLDAVAALPEWVEVRVPKVETAADVAVVRERSPGRRLHALVETALGIENAFKIACSDVSSIGLGEADLRSQLGLPRGLEGDAGLAWQRSRVVNAAAAAGLVPPIMSVYTNVRDVDGLRESSRAGRAMGFLGRSAIHPAQLPVIRDAFAPTRDDVSRAEEILARVGGDGPDSAGVFVLDDGSFLDAAMVSGARRTIAVARRQCSTERNIKKSAHE